MSSPWRALHTRTGDPVWLDRTWQFAGHAVAQSRALQQAHGMLRATLWMGEVGVAWFVRACAAVNPRWPSLELLERADPDRERDHLTRPFNSSRA